MGGLQFAAVHAHAYDAFADSRTAPRSTISFISNLQQHRLLADRTAF